MLTWLVLCSCTFLCTANGPACCFNKIWLRIWSESFDSEVNALTTLTLFRFHLVNRFWYWHVNKKAIINYGKTWKKEKERGIFCDISPELCDLHVLPHLEGSSCLSEVAARWDWALVLCCVKILLDMVKAVLSCTPEKLHLLVSCRQGTFWPPYKGLGAAKYSLASPCSL